MEKKNRKNRRNRKNSQSKGNNHHLSNHQNKWKSHDQKSRKKVILNKRGNNSHKYKPKNNSHSKNSKTVKKKRQHRQRWSRKGKNSLQRDDVGNGYLRCRFF